MSTPTLEAASFTGLIDLASERLGGKVLAASDDFFAEKENLIKAGRGIFIPDKYTENGKWMDGWESRRKRIPGYDWAILQLGVPGSIQGVDIDTNHFLGNHPPYASVDACQVATGHDINAAQWTEILPKVPLKAGSQNLFAVASTNTAWTHVRLNIYPDGGVARFRVYGNVSPQQIPADTVVDLAAIENGGQVVACSDMFFGNKDNMVMPGRAANMGDGWESRRRRGPGNDWAVVKLAAPGTLEKVLVDTNHFKGNYPDRFQLEGCYLPEGEIDILNAHTMPWETLIPETKLEAHKEHFFENLAAHKSLTHVRISIYPDGGISRLRLFGKQGSGR